MKFSSIQKLFPSEEWDVGLLTKEQLKIASYCPIKWKSQLSGEFHRDYTNDIHFIRVVNTIVLVKHSVDSFDYSLYEDASKILVENKLENSSKPKLNYPDISLMISDEVIVYDNLKKSIFIIVHGSSQDENLCMNSPTESPVLGAFTEKSFKFNSEPFLILFLAYNPVPRFCILIISP